MISFCSLLVELRLTNELDTLYELSSNLAIEDFHEDFFPIESSLVDPVLCVTCKSHKVTRWPIMYDKKKHTYEIVGIALLKPP